MKRMNFIRVVLPLVVMTFMAVGASAQNFLSPTQAAVKIKTTVAQLSSPNSNAPTNQGGTMSAATNHAVVNDASVNQALKVSFLVEVGNELKLTQDTGAAIENVYTALSQQMNGRPTTKLDAVRDEVIVLLSN